MDAVLGRLFRTEDEGFDIDIQFEKGRFCRARTARSFAGRIITASKL